MLLPIGCSMFPLPKSQPLQVTLKPMAVFIDNCGKAGSGVIYHQEGNTYQVLTNRHVVTDTNTGNPLQGCIVVTYDDKINQVKNISFPVDKLDLAMVEFSSNETPPYPIAKIGDSKSLNEGDTVYVVGAPSKSKDFYRAILVEEGKIKNNNVFDQNKQGYTLAYSNQTTSGMSGAPVFDSQGRWVAIHGKTDNRDGFKSNFGIPVALFTEGDKIVQRGNYNPNSTSQPIASQKTPEPIPTTQTTTKLQTAKADFRNLDQLLAAGKWKEADAETWALMKKITNRETKSWLRNEDYKNFPREYLRILDQMWVKYSNRRFGFSIQKQIWINSGGTPSVYNSNVYLKFADKVGWRKNGSFLSYSDLTFNTIAPPAHLPARGGWRRRGGEVVISFLFSRL